MIQKQSKKGMDQLFVVNRVDEWIEPMLIFSAK